MEVTIKVGKETTDVLELVADLIKDIKAKKGVSEIAAENLPGLYKAVEGFDQIDDEMRSEHLEETIALGVAKIVKAIRA